MKLYADVLLSLLLVTKAFFVECGEKKFWQVTSPYTKDKQISMNHCLLKCDKSESKINAVLADDGTCSCDHFQYAPSSIYMYRQGQSLLDRCLIFSPFTSNFKSMGSENVVETIHGTAISFSEDGPPGHLHGKKALRLKATRVDSTVNYFSYNLPQSLLDKVKASGMILTFWVRFVAQEGAVIDFRKQEGTIAALHFYMRSTKLWTNFYANTGFDMPLTAMNWNHIAFVFRQNTYEIREIGVVQNANSHSGSDLELSDTISFGYRRNANGDENYADIALYCFTLQELGDKTDAEITDAIDESKGACDHY